MSAPAAISGTFSDYRLVKSRGVLQLVVEIAVERQGEAFAALGYPVPGAEIHVALARLVASPAQSAETPQPSARSEQGKARYANSTARQQALVRAARLPKDPRFQQWAWEWYGTPNDEEGAITLIRSRCGGTRKNIDTDAGAYDAFVILETDFKAATNQMPEVR